MKIELLRETDPLFADNLRERFQLSRWKWFKLFLFGLLPAGFTLTVRAGKEVRYNG